MSLTEKSLISNAMDLVYLAEINFLICQKIYTEVLGDTIKNWPAATKQKTGQDFLLLTANNAFNESVNIIHTLISSTIKQEIRLKPLVEEALKRDSNNLITISEDKINQFTEQISIDYPNPDYLNYSFLLENDSRLIGEVLADIRKQKRHVSGLDDLNNLKTKFEKFGFHKIRHQLTAHKNKLLDSPGGNSRLYLRIELIDQLGEVIKELKIGTHFWFDYQLGNPLMYLLDSFGELVTK